MDSYLRECLDLVAQLQEKEGVIASLKQKMDSIGGLTKTFDIYGEKGFMTGGFYDSTTYDKFFSNTKALLYSQMADEKLQMSGLVQKLLGKMEKPVLISDEDFCIYKNCVDYVRGLSPKYLNFDKDSALLRSLVLTKAGEDIQKRLYSLTRSFIESDRTVVERLLDFFPPRQQFGEKDLILRECIDKLITTSLHREFEGRGEDAILSNFVNNIENFQKILRINGGPKDDGIEKMLADKRISKTFKAKIGEKYRIFKQTQENNPQNDIYFE